MKSTRACVDIATWTATSFTDCVQQWPAALSPSVRVTPMVGREKASGEVTLMGGTLSLSIGIALLMLGELHIVSEESRPHVAPLDHPKRC